MPRWAWKTCAWVRLRLLYGDASLLSGLSSLWRKFDLYQDMPLGIFVSPAL
jgi:hypothetical protein